MTKLRLSLAAPAVLATASLFAAPVFAQEAPATPAPATTPAPAPAAAKPAAELPTAASILERATAAIGGLDAWSKIQSLEVKGQIELPGQGIKGPMHTITAQPNKMLTHINFAGIGDIRTGFDGAVGWAQDRISGTRLLEGGELETMVREADFMRDADPVKRWDKVETVGDGIFGGFDCWKISATRGTLVSTLWYEKSTGLQRGLELTMDTQFGKVPVSTVLKEYKEFEAPSGKVKLPVVTEAAQMGQKMLTSIDSVTFDKVDPAAFALPDGIKALLEPEPAEEADATADAPAATPAEPAKPAAPAAPAAPAQPKKEG